MVSFVSSRAAPVALALLWLLQMQPALAQEPGALARPATSVDRDRGATPPAHPVDRPERLSEPLTGALPRPATPVDRAEPLSEPAHPVDRPERLSEVLAPSDLASPRATMRTLLVAMNALWSEPDAWQRAVATIETLEPDALVQRERARQLYAVLNRIELVAPERLPDAASATTLTRYHYFPDPQRDRALLRRIGAPRGGIALRRGDDGGWRFSADTVATLPALYAQLEPLPLVAGRELVTVVEWLESWLPVWLVENRFFTVKYWAWLAIFGVILLGLVADLLTRALLRGLSERVTRRTADASDPSLLHAALRPIGLFAAALVWMLPLGLLELDPLVERVIGGALRIFLVLAGTLSIWRLIDLGAGVLAQRAARTATRIDDVLIPLVSRALKLFVLAMGVIYAADALNIPITPLLASLTVAGVGFSFAAKDTVENFFGSVAVVLDRPFDIGDWVVIDGTEGIVEQVGFRSTRIRTFYNSQITVPNSNLVRASVDNYGRRQYRRWNTTLGLQYDTPPDKLVAFTEGIRELIRTHPYTRKDYYQVWCNEFSASSLDVLLYIFFDVPDWNTELRERERLFLDILRLADQLGVHFAFPTRTVHVMSPGAGPVAEAAPPPARESERNAQQEGVQAARALVRDQVWRSVKPGPVVFAGSPTDAQLDAAGNPVEAHAEDEGGTPKQGDEKRRGRS